MSIKKHLKLSFYDEKKLKIKLKIMSFIDQFGQQNISHYALVFKKQKFINAERIAREGISLPIDPNLKKSEIKKIYKVVNSLS